MIGLMAYDAITLYGVGAVGSTVILFGSLDTFYLSVWTQLALLFIPMQIVLNYYFGLYSRMWRYASVGELLSVVRSATLGTVVVMAVMAFRSGFTGIAMRTVPLYWLLTTTVLGATRFAARLHRESRHQDKVIGERALIFGAGSAGINLLREIRRHPELGINPMGFIDDDTAKHGLIVDGIEVLGGREKTEEYVEQLEIRVVLLAVPSADTDVIRDMIRRGVRLGVKVLTTPALHELVSGKAQPSGVRAVQIEDLLRREEVKVDTSEIASHLAGKTVLVTGAGGSIGSELCRQIVSFMPHRLLLLGRGENSIYTINNELKDSAPGVEVVPLIADVKDFERLDQLFALYRPQVVFHAAAHKHVPLMESNPAEAIKNNVLGTHNISEISLQYGVESFILISTDKAVKPINVMGTTKRVAELVVQSLNAAGRTKYMAVRFGNVLGSRGSVVERFKGQIAAGGPVTVTHPEVERYFMTVSEAVSLVLEAFSLGKGGEIFLLDMGQPVRISDLAIDLIHLSGLRPGDDIEITYTGLRPGEKLNEDLFGENELCEPTVHPRIHIVSQEPPRKERIDLLVRQMAELSTEQDLMPACVLAQLKSLVPNNVPDGGVI